MSQIGTHGSKSVVDPHRHSRIDRSQHKTITLKTTNDQSKHALRYPLNSLL